MKIVQIVPNEGEKLYDDLVKKQGEIRKKGRGTFRRTGRAARSSATWKHKAYRGSVALKRGPSGSVTAKIRAPAHDREWQMLSAFLGFVDRHLDSKVSSITIDYR